jgi:hypothetical protein
MQLLQSRRARPARIASAALMIGPLAVALTLAGCLSAPAPTAGQQALSQIQQGPGAEKNEFGLNRVDIPKGQGILYVKSPRPHLEQYDRLSIDSVEIKPDQTPLPWRPKTTARLRKSFLRTLTSTLASQSTWRLTDESGPGVLGMRVRARELKVINGLPHVSASRSSRNRVHNTTTLVMELYDQTSGEVLVQFIQRRDLPTQVVGASRNRFDRLRVYYSRFAQSMADSLAQLGQAVEAVRTDDENRILR